MKLFNVPTLSRLLAVCCVAILSVDHAGAQQPAAKAPAKPQAKAPAKATSSSSREQARTKANQMATGIMAAEIALTPDQLELAKRVETGRIRCELGATVAVLPDSKQTGVFMVTSAGKQGYRMVPAMTTTGAIKLEDKAKGGVWLQLANKSMLLDEKNGKRLADECATDAQRAVGEALKANPAPSVLDAPAPKP